jgi:hypothetical protein
LWQERESWQTTEVSSIPNDDPEVLTKVKFHVIKTAAVHDDMLSKLINYHSSWIKLQRNQWRNSYELYPVRAGGSQGIWLPGGTLN